MRGPRPSLPLSVGAVLALLLVPGAAEAQLIGVRTVPVASGDPFLVHASARLGMADVSVALDDVLLDPFTNPAAGARLDGSFLLTAPTTYGISGDNGGAHTLPLSAMFTGRGWFGGASLALQEVIDESGRDPWVDWFSSFAPPPSTRLSERSSSNLFTHLFAGRRIGDGVAVGASVALAELSAMDGVDLLYANHDGLEQDGSRVGVRVGLTAERDDGTRWEVVALYDRLDMTHELRRLVWTDPPAGSDEPSFSFDEQVERDDTRTLGLHVSWLGAPRLDGWRTGAALTVNRKEHASIPNYELQNIPRDPGETWAWNAAAGIAREAAGVTVAADVNLEPIWSETWAEAETALTGPEDRVIHPGERTVDNDFFFANVHLRVGAALERGRWEAQAGVAASRYGYDLEQVDHVAGTTRDQHESWMEWTPTWGGSVRLGDVRVRYAGRLTTGTGRPGVDGGLAWEGNVLADFVIAPSGPLTLQEAHVWTHQLVLAVPLG